MPAINVAIQDDVQATPGTDQTYNGASVGTWTAGTITYKKYSKLTISRSPIIYEASCQFTFAGSTSGGTAVGGTETVTLKAATTKLQKDFNSALRNRDETTDSHGNKLAVSSTRKLKSG